MQILSTVLGLGALVVLLGACGNQFSDRALSGAGIGALGAAALQMDPLTGAIVGGVIGGVTNSGTFNLGHPVWD